MMPIESENTDFGNYMYKSLIDLKGNVTSTDLEKLSNPDLEIAKSLSGWSLLGIVLMLVFAVFKHLAKRDRLKRDRLKIPEPIPSVDEESKDDSGFFEEITEVPIFSSNVPSMELRDGVKLVMDPIISVDEDYDYDSRTEVPIFPCNISSIEPTSNSPAETFVNWTGKDLPRKGGLF